MRTSTVRCINTQGFHQMNYHEWGSVDNERVLFCVHGLTRNSRDFDDIALALSHDYRVICPDVVGRGNSDWLPPEQPYEVGQYLQDMIALLAAVGAKKVDWIGTSMGGIIGMSLAAMPDSPIRSLVLNDVGSRIPASGLQRISGYLGPQSFASLEEVEQQMRINYPSLSLLNDKQWQHLARHAVHERGGRLVQHYDPAIAAAFGEASSEDIDLSFLFSAVQAPVMLVWGEQSDILPAEVVEEMKQLKPEMRCYPVPHAGHVPSLMEKDQIEAIRDWLRSVSAKEVAE